MRQPTWKLLVIACIITFVIGLIAGAILMENTMMKKMLEQQELLRESGLVAQKAVLMSNRAGETLKRVMEDLNQVFTWNELMVVE